VLFRRLLPAITWAVTVAFLSIAATDGIPQIELWKYLPLDKISHGIMYAVLTYLLLVGFYKQRDVRVLRDNGKAFAIFISVGYGVLMEIAQLLVFTQRNFEWMDIAANTVGTFTGLTIFILIFGDSIKN
jgi:VanZ family protein